MSKKKFLIVGGGIAGISCLESLILDHDENSTDNVEIILVSESRLIKRVTNYKHTGRELASFDVDHDDISTYTKLKKLPHNLQFRFIAATVESIDSCNKIIRVRNQEYSQVEELNYDVLCLCCGSKPKQLIYQDRNHFPELCDRLIVIRDTTSIDELHRKLTGCKRLAIIGNGGIGLELVTKIENCYKVWIIKDESIGLNYFDSGAAKFLLDHHNQPPCAPNDTIVKGSAVYASPSNKSDSSIQSRHHYGPSLGPDWFGPFSSKRKDRADDLEIIYQDEVSNMVFDGESRQDKVLISTRRGKLVKCDLVVVAIGVEPNVAKVIPEPLQVSAEDGGILIDEQMKTSVPHIYAAGDVVSCEKWPKNDLWFQMRLWTQARQMGFYAGRCIASHSKNSDPSLYFNFDCFCHCTTFFGKKLVLLGRFNGQGLTEVDGPKCEVIARVIKGQDYVKIILKENRIIGAVLIGDTELEETIENLIHDQIDVADQKDGLLDGSIDIADYFD